MKSSTHYLTFVITLFLLASCIQKESSAPSSDSTESERAVSSSYKAPFFENDNRIEKIKEIAPELHELMVKNAKDKHLPGVAYGVVVDNELIVSSAIGVIDIESESPATTQSAFRIASMTKSFTAMAILKLRDEGKLSLEDPVSKYIPQMKNLEYLTSDSPTIDIENLLTMTAGFPEDNPWGDRQLDESDQMLIDLVAGGMSFSNPPSYKFEYSNTGYALLGNVISKVSGIPYQKYIKDHILKPLGMEHTYWEFDSVPKEILVKGYRWEDENWKSEPMLHDGSYGAMGGLITSIEDFSKYVSFQLSAWPPRSDPDIGPVKRSSLREMQTPQFSNLYAKARDFKGDTCAIISGYGYGLGIAKYCNGLKRVSHGGALPGFGSNYVYFPEYGIGLMAFCNLTYTSPWPFNDLAKLIFEKDDLETRKLPASDILKTRKAQIVELIKSWGPALEAQILAENFYMDMTRESYVKEMKELMEKAGPISSIGEIDAYNQLRGTFKIHTENGAVEVFYTMSPEKDPLIQMLDLELQLENQPKQP
ncbi:MAG: serine hydrolase domain-containing protein [Lutimonas sp.]